MFPFSSGKPFIRLCFERCAGHLANLSDMKRLVDQIVDAKQSIEQALVTLEKQQETGDATMRTDIRILINEIRHDAKVQMTSE